MTRQGLSEEVAFRLSPEGQGASHTKVGGAAIAARGKSSGGAIG